MVVEIDEMVVRASMGEAHAPGTSGGAPGQGAGPALDPDFGNMALTGLSSRDLEYLHHKLLGQCRQMILEILADREER